MGAVEVVTLAFQQLLSQQQAQTVEMAGGLQQQFQLAMYSMVQGVKGEGKGTGDGELEWHVVKKESLMCMPKGKRSS